MKATIFKTDIKNKEQAHYLLSLLRKNISDALINFDFRANDTLLTIEVNRDISGIVHSLFTAEGVQCQQL